MNRSELERFIAENYNADVDHPWMKYPDNEVFRHCDNKKWFALIMNIPESKLGLPGDRHIDVINLKCDPFMIPSLLNEKGFYPAYHMNKSNWITVALDGSESDDKTAILLDISFEATSSAARRKKHR